MAEHLDLDRWDSIEHSLRAAEDLYLVERVRKGGKPSPEGQAREKLERDLDAACELYIHGSPIERERIRGAFTGAWLLSRELYRRAQYPLRTDKSPEQDLRRALAAYVLWLEFIVAQNGSQGFGHGDFFLPLGAIWVQAHRDGLDPSACMREAQGWVTEGKAGDRARDFLHAFPTTAYFRADVIPRLSPRE